MSDSKKAEDERKAQRERFKQTVTSASEEFSDAMPVSIPHDVRRASLDRVVKAVLYLGSQKPDVLASTPGSIGRCVALCALTGLMPGGAFPLVDLIPRVKWKRAGDEWVKDRIELNWQIGWRGYVALAERSGVRVKPVNVFEGERFLWREGLEQTLEHEPDVRVLAAWETLVASYVVVSPRGAPVSDRSFAVLRRSGIEERRAKSEAWKQYEIEAAKAQRWEEKNPDRPLPDSMARELARAEETPWVQWPLEQSLKTVVRYAGSRAIIPFDDVAAYALSQDRDVVDAEDIAPDGRVRPRAPVSALPDHDPLGMDDAPEREREPARTGLDDLDHALRGAAPPPPATAPPPPSSEAETRKRVRAPDARLDAEALEAALVAKSGAAGWKLPCRYPDEAKQVLKAALNADRMTDERVIAAVDYGVAHLGWRREGISLLPRTTPPPPPPASPAPASSSSTIPELEEALGGELVSVTREQLGLPEQPQTWTMEQTAAYRLALETLRASATP